MANVPRYSVYCKHKNYKRGACTGFYTDDFIRALKVVDNMRKSWHGQNGIYNWIKIKDTSVNKYIYEYRYDN